MLALAVLVGVVRWPALGSVMTYFVVLQLGLLVGLTVIAVALARHEGWGGVPFVRPLATIGVIFTLYGSLGQLGVAAMPYLADAALSRIDHWLFGVDPSLWIQRYRTPGRVEFFSFFYAAFIPYIHLSLALNCLGRPPVDRDQFLTGWVFTYAISFLGYLFVPGHEINGLSSVY